MSKLPQWIREMRRDRGLCEECGDPGCSFWQSEDGPWLCWRHIEAKREENTR